MDEHISETYKNIFLYQSMSGDADEGTASFTAKDSTITTNKGDTIFVTNTINGNIYVDSISTLTMKLSNGSKYTGTINGEKTAKTISLSLDSSSSITLTGDTYITSLDNADSTNSNINFNGHKLYVNGTAIN